LEVVESIEISAANFFDDMAINRSGGALAKRYVFCKRLIQRRPFEKCCPGFGQLDLDANVEDRK
jgi:hypothetical protein